LGSGTVANPFVVLRGQSKAVTGTGAPGVLSYFNDVPLPNYGSLIQTYDMANIQVLKGPQGTLFGRNSIGGALLTYSQEPTPDFGGYGSIEVGSYDLIQFEGAVNMPIVQDKIVLRVAGQVGHDGGNVDTFLFSPYKIDPSKLNFANPADSPGFAIPGQLVPSKRNVDEFRTASFRASLLIEPNDWIKNLTVFDHSLVRGTPNTVTQSFASFNSGPPAIYQFPSSVIAGVVGPPGSPADQLFFANVYANAIIPALAQCSTNQIQCNFNVAANALSSEGLGKRVQYATQDPWLARTIVQGITNTTSIMFGDHTLKNIFAIRTTDSFSNTSLSGLPLPVINTASQTRLKQVTEELQLSGSLLDNRLQYTLGGFFYEEKPNGLGGYQALEVNALFGLAHTLSTTYLYNKSKAIYGQVDYSLDALVEGLSVTAGARQTWDEQSACTTAQTVSPFAPQMLIQTAGSQEGIVPSEEQCLSNGAGPGVVAQVLPVAKFNKLTYTLGLNWEVTPQLLIYATTRRGYRAGGYNTPVYDPYLASLQTYAPESLTDYEIGTKFRWSAGEARGSVDLAVFTGKDKGNQLPINTSNLNGGTCIPEAVGTGGRPANCSTPGGQAGTLVRVVASTTTDNAGELTIRGFELAATVSPFPALTLGGNVGYVDAKVDKVELNAALLNVLTKAGRFAPSTIVIQGQPTWTVNGNITVDVPGKVIGGNLSAGLDFHYNSNYQQVEVKIPSQKQFDFRARLSDIADTGLTLTAYVKNLTDSKTYYGGGSTSPSGVGVTSFILGKPRTFGLELLYRFGS
jgi:iron complex outermembrane recepter protein